MKLAEALNLRSDLQKRIAALRKRVAACSVVQEGEQAAEDPLELIDKCKHTLDALEQLTCAINRVNSNYRTPQGQTLTELLARRDNLLQLHSVLNDAAEDTRRDPDRFGLREIKWVAILDVADLHDRCDDLGRQIRDLNNTIQAINWLVEME